MFVEVLVALACVAVYWYFNVRMVDPHRALVTVKLAAASRETWDYIVVGGGVSGAAAVAAIREADPDPHCRILLIEGGKLSGGSMLPLPNYTLDLVGTDVDWSLRVARPFAEEVLASPVGVQGVTTIRQGMKPYPRGRGVGGTQQIDHQIYFPAVHNGSAPSENDAADAWLKRHVVSRLTSLPVLRSPLSAVFAASLKQHPKIQPYLPPEMQDGSTLCTTPMLKQNHVSPHYLWLDSRYGTRPNLARYLLDACTPSTTVRRPCVTLLNTIVTGFEEVKDADTGVSTISSISCRTRGGVDAVALATKVSVRRAVICCAGNFASARLIHSLTSMDVSSSSAAVHHPLQDVVSVPLIYQAMPGVTDDPVMTQSLTNIFAWYVARRGGLLQVVADTSVVVQCSSVPGASLLITMYPCGGQSRQRYHKMGLSPVLAVFPEAFHFNIGIYQMPSSNSRTTMSTFHFSSETAAQEKTSGGLAGLCLAPLPATQSEQVEQCLVEGMKLCREWVQISPLGNLTTKKEALDTTLFPAKESAAIFSVLYPTNPTGRKSNRGPPIADEKIKELRLRALELATTDEYLMQYVRRHARYAGYASSSLCNVVDPLTMTVRQSGSEATVSNLFVGDTSVVPADVGARSGLHNAGSTTTAMMNGFRAGTLAVRSTSAPK